MSGAEYGHGYSYGSIRAKPGQFKDRQNQDRCALSWKGMTKAGPDESWQIKAREEQDRIRTVASRAAVIVEADLGLTKRMARKKHGRSAHGRQRLVISLSRQDAVGAS